MSLFYEVLKSDFSVIHNKRELAFKEHMHKYIEILYVFSGVQHITIEDKSYAVSEGEAAIIFPNTLHSYYKDGAKTADALLIIFDPIYVGALFPNLENACTPNPIIPKEKITDETIFAVNTINKDSPIEKKLGYTIIIFSNLFGCVDIKHHTHIPAKDLAPRIIDYIAVNYPNEITRDTLAAEFKVSKYHISRIFAEKFKMNLKTYLSHVRCGKAAELLRSSDFKITTISRLTGFDSLRTFNRCFKQTYGITPTQYKNTIIK